MIFGAVAVFLAVVLLIGNILFGVFSDDLREYFGKGKAGSTTGAPVSSLMLSASDALVQDVAEDSIVLLKNENAALPLAADEKVNLFGWNASDNGFLLTGTGSGGTEIPSSKAVTLRRAFELEGREYNEELLSAYAAISSVDADKNGTGGQAEKNATELHNPKNTWYTAERMNQAWEYSHVAVIVLSRNSGENIPAGELYNIGSYQKGAILELTEDEKVMLLRVTEKFADGKVIVLLNTTNNMELGFLEEYNVDAALYVGMLGQSGALAIPRILWGETTEYNENGDAIGTRKVSPSGRTADIYPYEYNADKNGKVYSPTLANALSNNSSIVYEEDIYYGYKWYETADEEGFFDDVSNNYGDGYYGVVQYPFGHGLSYSKFKWQVSWPSAKTLTKDAEYTVRVKVTNETAFPAKEVVQLYYTAPYIDGGIEKAHVNLLDFGKTVALEQGQSQVLELKFTAYDLASYDCYDKNKNEFSGYELDAGTHYLKLMVNSHDAAVCYDYNDKDRTVASEYGMSCSGIKFEEDPVTGTEVVNRFTGDGAYANMPIDGTTVLDGVNYLSRAGGFKNFPDAQVKLKSGTNLASTKSYQYTGWNDNPIINKHEIKYQIDSGIYLLTDMDGNKLNSFTGEVSYNEETMRELADYDSELWDVFLDQLSKSEIENLIKTGAFQTIELISVGKPKCDDKDGPSGFNNGVGNTNVNSGWAAFPSEGLIGCSWSQATTYNMGTMQGMIASATGLHGWYGPGVNLHRSPYNGRNFEYYSEDGVLSGKLAAECIRGAKNQNLYCYLKHFAVSEAGKNPNEWATWLTEQNLRENYLKPFEIAVKKGGANAMMSAFNCVGAVWCGTNYALSTAILRNEWGFRGSMITDWNDTAYMNVTRGILAGNDLWLASNGAPAASGSINFNNAAQAYCARQSAKNIIYTYIDTELAAMDYDPTAERVPIIGAEGTTEESNGYTVLLVVYNVVIGVVLLACVALIFLPLGKAKATVADSGSAEQAAEGEAEIAADATESDGGAQADGQEGESVDAVGEDPPLQE